ncbi:MAG: DUF2085 domain-containing protein [Anaerolineae bacterium]|nr:DUF2085 domain-containing protein [Anaerolineae bacterium]
MGFLFLYTGLALMPPVLMETGHDGAANVIHKIYGPMCHQFAFRSWFFFGDQMVYPREAAGTSLGSFEEYAAADSHFAGVNLYEWSSDMQLKARSFTGNEHMGYKTALCERDVAIYGVMFLMGLLFTRVRKWLRPVPIWLYLLLGLVPLGLDGFSQMFGYPPFEFWPVRETLPAFRVLTGALFGLMNVWLAFPHLEASMQETQNVMGTRLALVEQRLADLQAMAE